MNLVRLHIRGISYSQSQKEAYALILSELDTDIKLPIIIGAFEAQAIALELEKKSIPPRPFTHDLFKNFAETFHIQVTQVVIHKLIDGVFYSDLVCVHQGKEYRIDARTSDAIAIALRFQAPIFTYKSILDRAGVQISIQPDHDTSEIKPSLETPQASPANNPKFAKYSLEELNGMLGDCVENEDYEMAAEIRDEISRRTESF